MGIRFSSLFRLGIDERGLISSDAARLVVARQELDLVLAGQQREAGVVFDGLLGQLRPPSRRSA